MTASRIVTHSGVVAPILLPPRPGESRVHPGCRAWRAHDKIRCPPVVSQVIGEHDRVIELVRAGAAAGVDHLDELITVRAELGYLLHAASVRLNQKTAPSHGADGPFGRDERRWSRAVRRQHGAKRTTGGWTALFCRPQPG
ncbi:MULTISPECIES: hypothetical protein [unclassified Pseudonocardia]|uniref:hypothetical protein n=1 Tax=unclassified Pseudonocardia TaxID=2619320 RepID=UPI0011151623|nr:hypothetical protein [Pseudonocardia sp. Ae707_Ps1]